jgi:hypothetical protein
MDSGEVVQSQEVAPVVAPVVSAPTEKMLSQSEVNDIVGRAKHDAIESFKRQQAQRQPEAVHAHADRSQNTFAESDVRRLAAEEAQRLRDEWYKEAQSKADESNAQRIVKDFWSKVETGKSKYEDFDQVTGDIDLGKFPNVVQMLADHMDNSSDVLYELGKDRLKLAQLEQLSYMSPRDAIVQAKRLAQSIKDNEQSQSVRTAREPLSQQRPSNTGMDSGNVLSVSDYRRRYKV